MSGGKRLRDTGFDEDFVGVSGVFLLVFLWEKEEWLGVKQMLGPTVQQQVHSRLGSN